jgi:tetratricopeptide (TPR) repeat protein
MVERKEQAKSSQLKRYLDAANDSMQRGDPAAASNAYRLAMSIEPENEEIKRAYEDADAAATTLLADGYLRQGEYEERAERWREAARSYARAADGMPSQAHVQNKAAHAMLRANLDMRKAADYAKRATGLEPNNAEYHSNLGQIYLAAGLALNAKREMELAAELDPEDAKIARLLQAVRTG